MTKIFHFIIAICVSFIALDANAFTVVIDPGHGGKDVGACGKVACEKDINLDVALRLGKLLVNENIARVVYTRTKDEFVDLHQRASIANESKADLFISLHCNSMNSKTSGRENYKGTVTYVLGGDALNENLEVVHRENSVISLEEDFVSHYQSFDINSPESHVIYELNQRQYLKRSLELAEQIERNMTSVAHRRSGGIYQAGFIVLSEVAMPSVLVELDYISNPKCEAFLASDSGAQLVARALARSIANYSMHK